MYVNNNGDYMNTNVVVENVVVESKSNVKQSCKDVIKSNFTSRLKDLRKLYKAYVKAACSDNISLADGCFEELSEYGLHFEYNLKDDCFIWLLSTGGPHDEIRAYLNLNGTIRKFEYRYLDWFDGSKVAIFKGERFELLKNIFTDFFMLDDSETREWYIKRASE